MRRARLALAAVPFALVLWLLAALALDRLGRRPPPDGRWDAIVVLGCGVGPDGRPAPALRHRVERAVALWRQGLAPVIVFTGGLGAHPPSEAEAAAAHARALGLPPSAVRLEDRSTSTEENARFTAALHPNARVLVVTDAYHVFRARRVFARHFPAVAAAGSVAPLPSRARGALREVAAVAWYALTGRL